MALNGITAVIIGANRGIGLGWVDSLSAIPNNKVIATARDPSKADQLQALAKERKNIFIQKAEMTNDADLAVLASYLEKSFPHVNLLVNNAAINVGVQSIDKATKAEMIKSFEVNTLGPLAVTQALLPHLRKAAAAKQVAYVVNNSSLLGSNVFIPPFTFRVSPYNVSKAALNMVNSEFSKDFPDVQFLALSPGYVKTDMSPEGVLSVQESVSGSLKVVEEEIALKKSGRFRSYDGKVEAF